MQQMAFKEAETRLPELLGMVAEGEEIIVTKDDGSGFKIVPFPDNTSHPKYGSARGLVEISDDFDEPVDGFEKYMP